MPSEVILPRVDMDMATGKISKWLVGPGTRVAKGQPLFEIETDKAAMEIEAPASGTVRTVVEASGEDIPVGSVVAWIYAEGEPEASAAPAASLQAAPDADRFAAEDRSFDSALPAAATDRSAAPSPEAPVVPAATASFPGSPGAATDRPRATPLARRLARDQGLDLTSVTGSGPRGRVQAADVERANARRPTAVPLTVAPTREPDLPRPALAEPSSPAAAPARAPAGALNLVLLRDGAGAPIVLIHGWGADANGWRPFLQGQRLGQPVLGLDLPGHGGSGLGAVASFGDLVDAVEEALAAAGLGAAHVVGHSLGAAAAAAAAARGRLDLKSLLLLSPAGLGPSVNGAFLRGYLGATSEASLTPWMRELVADPAMIGAPFVRATLKAREGTALVDTQRRVAAAVFPDDTQAFSIRADLATLQIPTRVVFGGADRILSSAQATGLPGLVASHLFPQVGHMPQIEVRDAVAAIFGQMTGSSWNR